MNFRQTSKVFNSIEETSSRNEIIQIVSDFYKKLEGEEIDIFSYLLIGRVAPKFVDAEFNMSEKGLISLLEEIVELNKVDVDVVSIRQNSGDIGLTAQQVLGSTFPENKKRSIQLSDLYEQLWEIVNVSGEGSVQRRSSIIAELFKKMNGMEAKYLCRIITGKLRLGASDKTLLDALSLTISGDKSLRSRIEQNYGLDPDIGYLAHRVLALGSSSEKKGIDPSLIPESEITFGIPVLSRLVERVTTFEEVFERLGGEMYIQPKYDGLRAQVHKGVDYKSDQFHDRTWTEYLSKRSDTDDFAMFEENVKEDNVRIFTRNLEDMTEMFPEVVVALNQLSVDKVILDCEIVGWDSKKLAYVPFQETMTRKRKYDVQGATAKVPIKLYIFDILAVNGSDITQKDLSERLKILSDIAGIETELDNLESEDIVMIADTKKITEIEQMDREFNDAVERKLEGLIAKKIDGGYQPGKRNHEWLKLKKSMEKALVDSVDVVIMGYYYGSGKRSDFGIGALLAGVVDRNEEVYSLTKIGTGITDSQLSEIVERLKPLVVDDQPDNYHVSKDLQPDVWVLPEVVCSVEADEVTSSKAHLAAKDDEGRGLALRFPRLIEFDRDKSVGDATSESELRKMFKGG